ncbi:sulfatase family protein [Schlesneria paludicola]|uniref:sulfatase family protein n=1 Tax=Schlesneria paludicola TaxID=360056 RepID=UPI00029AA8F6|nr:sulfatase [Schlesneria paludicola]
MCHRCRLFLLMLILEVVAGTPLTAADAKPVVRPNILWFIVDDMSANFSSFGERQIQTPHVDRLVREGTQFTKCFVTAPVCSPCRSALIAGMYQTTIGAHNHRSGRGVEKIHLPAGVEPVPVLFQRAGYYTGIGSWPSKEKGLGKTDYNFEWDQRMYDGNDWSGRKPGQPFFMQVQLHGGKHRHAAKWAAIAERELGSTTRPDDVQLPPYYPRDTVILQDWAEYLDTCRLTDQYVGEVMKRLADDGLLENTIVFFMTDHGISHARGKQFLYDEGLHVPLVIRGPGIVPGVVRDDLVEHIDLAATSLALAGIPQPKGIQSRDILAKNYVPRDAVFAARDRCDETVEHLRSVRTSGYKYIRNFLPERPHLQPNAYKDGKLIIQRLRQLHAQGQLPQLTETLLFAPTRPPEELYDLREDPFETKNLAGDSGSQSVLLDLRGRLDRWMDETRDQGRQPESEALYDSDMAVYLGEQSGRPREKRTPLEENVQLMKQWAREGK